MANTKELLPEAQVHFKNFLSLFYHDISGKKLENNNTLHLFTLRIQNNDFAYTDLTQILRDALIPYVLSRNTRKGLGGKIGTISKRAREKFRNYWIDNQKEKKADKEGELGELLLYAFLESHLKAPMKSSESSNIFSVALKFLL